MLTAVKRRTVYAKVVGSELASEIVPGPTAVIVDGSISGELDTVREIEPPEKHMGDITIGQQVETVLEVRANTDEYELPTKPSTNLLNRVRIEMQKRRVQGRLLTRHV